MIRAFSYYNLALHGQSNANADNGDDVIGVVMPPIRASVHAGGTLVWWSTAGSTSAPRVDPAAGVAEVLASRGQALRVVKDAVGGSSIAEWIATYGPRHITAMRNSGLVFDGSIWAQGETECRFEADALAYQASLETLFGMYWAAFPNLKVCVVKVASSFVSLATGLVPDYIAEVRAAQVAFAAAHPALVTIIDADEYSGLQHDGVHRTGPQNRVIGARALAALEAL